MAYKQKVPKAITVRGVPDDLYWWLRGLAEHKDNRRSLSNQIVIILQDARRQAELPSPAFFGPIPNDAPEWREADKRD